MRYCGPARWALPEMLLLHKALQGVTINSTLKESVLVPMKTIRQHVHSREKSRLTAHIVLTTSNSTPVIGTGNAYYQVYSTTELIEFQVATHFVACRIIDNLPAGSCVSWSL